MHFDIYVEPADANESQFSSKNQSTFAANQLPAKQRGKRLLAKNLLTNLMTSCHGKTIRPSLQ